MANVVGYESINIQTSVGKARVPVLVLDSPHGTFSISSSDYLKTRELSFFAHETVVTPFTTKDDFYRASTDNCIYDGGSTPINKSQYSLTWFIIAVKFSDGIYYPIMPKYVDNDWNFTIIQENTPTSFGTALYLSSFSHTLSQYSQTAESWFMSIIVPDSNDPYSTDDNHTPSGGYGDFDYTGDDVDVPALPSLSASACGFVGLYNPTIGELKALADYMWTGVLDISTYKKIFGDPMDCILSVGIIPITPTRSTNKESLNFGNFINTGISAYKITQQFAELDCGEVSISGAKFSKSAMDYSPYTRAEIFLPFCGTHSISADEIMDATIGVVYHMDLYTGACVAYVKITKTNSDNSELASVMYQFTGNILATIPITGADHSNFIQSILFMGAAAAATVATAGGAAPEIGGAMAVGDSVSTSALGGAAISASGINAVMSMKPNIMRSGNLAANAGFLGLKKPVITLTLPNLCRPVDENELAGMPCQKTGTLSDFSGFNIIGACHLDNIPCTMEELRMIDTALAKGVIV